MIRLAEDLLYQAAFTGLALLLLLSIAASAIR